MYRRSAWTEALLNFDEFERERERETVLPRYFFAIDTLIMTSDSII